MAAHLRRVVRVVVRGELAHTQLAGRLSHGAVHRSAVAGVGDGDVRGRDGGDAGARAGHDAYGLGLVERLAPAPRMVHGISSAPRGRCTVGECTMWGPARHGEEIAVLALPVPQHTVHRTSAVHTSVHREKGAWCGNALCRALRLACSRSMSRRAARGSAARPRRTPGPHHSRAPWSTRLWTSRAPCLRHTRCSQRLGRALWCTVWGSARGVWPLRLAEEALSTHGRQLEVWVDRRLVGVMGRWHLPVIGMDAKGALALW